MTPLAEVKLLQHLSDPPVPLSLLLLMHLEYFCLLLYELSVFPQRPQENLQLALHRATLMRLEALHQRIFKSAVYFRKTVDYVKHHNIMRPCKQNEAIILQSP